jgi:hypothetical protein
VNGFGALMALSGNPDWQEQVRRADGPHGLPVINATRGVMIGGKVWLLVLFTNPLPDQNGAVRISAHVVVTLPDGTAAIDGPNIVCFDGPISGGAQLVRICNTNVQLGIDAGDPTGTWRIVVTVRDENRKTDVPLEDTLVVRGQ